MSDQGKQGLARVARLSEIDPVEVAGGLFVPIRRTLGVPAFGINAYTARSAGDQLIERHDETGSGSGRQEELYVVVSGHATFTVGDEEIDAPTGTMVFLPSVEAVRSAVAIAPDTTAIVVGGPADRPLPVSPFEYWFAAEQPYAAGDYPRAIEILSEALAEWPDHPTVHYQLACYQALAGERDEALEHFERACAGDARVKEWARDDTDLDVLRSDPRFVAATE
jgi:tetratricopeptide (TPR) repeat protein